MRITLGDHIVEINERTTTNNQHRVLTSSQKGIVSQDEYFNKQIASKENTGYKIVKRGQFTYRAMSDTGRFYINRLMEYDVGIVSPAYPVFEVIEDNIIYTPYIVLFFESDYFQSLIVNQSTGSTRVSLKLDKIKRISIDIPSYQEQKEIVEKIESVKRAIAARDEQLSCFNELVKSRFIELFGDPKSNPKGYTKKQLGETCKVITGNTPSRAVAEYYGDHIEWIKTDNIISGLLNPTTATEFLSEKGMTVSRTVESGAILMACIAGSVSSIGRVCVTNRKVAFNQQINAIVPYDYNILFLYAMLQISKEYLVDGINMALKGILSKSKLEEKTFFVPPIELQEQFAAFVEQTDKSKHCGEMEVAA